MIAHRSSIRIGLLAAVLTIAAQAHAVPLCRDGKGLFTPCTGTLPPRHRASPAQARAPGAVTATAPIAEAAAPAKPKGREMFEKTKLCRDSKGLFTPCAH